MVTRRLALASAALALLAAACDGAGAAEERFERGLAPARAILVGGVDLTASPAGQRTGADGRLILHAAAPSLTITLTAASAASVSFVLENVSAQATLDPAPDSRAALDEVTLEVGYHLAPGTTQVRVEPGGAGPVRFAVVSDLHENQALIASLVRQVRQAKPDAILSMGDLVSHGDAAALERLLGELHQAGVPFYMTLGNHEFGPATDWFLEAMGPSNVSFGLRGARVVLVDSATGDIAPSSWGWLADALDQRPEPAALVLTHIPPIDVEGERQNSFRVRDDAEHFLQVLSAGGATRLFVGHQHTWLNYSLRGIPVTLVGAGGDGVESLTGLGPRFAEVTVDPDGAELVKVVPRDLD